MRAITVSIVSGAVALLISSASLWAQSSVPVSNHWLLKNGLVSRAIDFDARNGIVTESWKNLTDGKEFINSSRETMDGYCREFRFVANDRAYTGTTQDFSIASAKESTDSTGAQDLDLNLTSSDQAVAVTVHYNLPADATGIRQFLDIRNQTARPLRLSQLSIACEPIEPAEPAQLLAYGGHSWAHGVSLVPTNGMDLRASHGRVKGLLCSSVTVLAMQPRA